MEQLKSINTMKNQTSFKPMIQVSEPSDFSGMRKNQMFSMIYAAKEGRFQAYYPDQDGGLLVWKDQKPHTTT